MLQLEEKV
jgi:hypothetical protein